MFTLVKVGEAELTGASVQHRSMATQRAHDPSAGSREIVEPGVDHRDRDQR